MSDTSLDQFVAQAVEPMPEPLEQVSPLTHVALTGLTDSLTSPLTMWYWDVKWNPVNAQDSIEKAMWAYILFWEKTGWRLIQLKHLGQENWQVNLLNQREGKLWKAVTGGGTTAAIAICEAIKAASLADAERATAETEVRG